MKERPKKYRNADQLSPSTTDKHHLSSGGGGPAATRTLSNMTNESMEKTASMTSASAQSPIRKRSTSAEQQANKKDYRSSLADGVSHMIDDNNAFDEERRITIERPHLRVPPVKPAKPIKPRQPSTASTEDGAPRSSVAVKPSDELRSQLPWSYFKSREDISGPKKTFHNLRADEDLPPVPVPDYTLHFPRKDQRTSKMSDDGSR